MILVRLRRTVVFVTALLVAACLVPSPADAAVGRHRAKRTHACEAPCLSSKWHNSLSSARSTERHPSDDIVDDFDDRDTRTDPTSSAVADDDATPATDSAVTLPWVRAHRAPDPHAARLVVCRRLAAPRPPPSL
jgi:hypothetical protein